SVRTATLHCRSGERESMGHMTRWSRLVRRLRRRSRQEGLSPWEDLLHELELDAQRYYRFAIPPGGNERFDTLGAMQLDAAATRHNHRVEKGFSLPETKRPFGKRAHPALSRALANADAVDGALFVT